LQGIGYRKSFIRKKYEYADCGDRLHPVRDIDLACFAQSPPDWRNACLGVTVANGLSGRPNVQRHLSLGAPLILEIGARNVSWWHFKGEQAVLGEEIPFDRIEKAFEKHTEEWAPDIIMRAKGVSLKAEPKQLDFVDMGHMSFLEGIIHTKTEALLKEVIGEAGSLLGKKELNQEDSQYIFRTIFRFLAAKIFRDRKHDPKWESNDAEEIFLHASEHYDEPLAATKKYPNEKELKGYVWQKFLDSFHFQNLSIDDLTYVYETAFITPEKRKEWGIHSTPSRIAEYIVRHLPFESIPEEKRRVLEPCSGHGIFLIAAMRKMRELLPQNWGEQKRHKYLKARLVGIENDPFAIEVSRLCLTLADYPNPNGWQLRPADIFTSDVLSNETGNSDIILCNPPFEKFTSKSKCNVKKAYKSAEVLWRVLSNPPALLGFVLQQTFLKGSTFSGFHQVLAKNYGNIEIISLPDNIFTHADTDSALLLASERHSGSSSVKVTCFDVKKSEAEVFCQPSFHPNYRKVVLDNKSSDLWIPSLYRVWNYLSAYPKLGDLATECHQGINWASDELLAESGKKESDRYPQSPRKDTPQGHSEQKKNIQQYKFTNEDLVCMSLEPELHYDGAYRYDWEKPKVVCCAIRFERENPWRIAAVLDEKGLVFTKNYFAFWAESKSLLNLILALLNSPIASACSFDTDLGGRSNHLKTLRNTPVPSIAQMQNAGVQEIVDHLIGSLRDDNVSEEKLKQQLLNLDAAILKAYDLPPRLERALLDTFKGFPRHTPFPFPESYYPEGFDACLPLHKVISEEFEQALVSKTLKRLKPIKDPVVSGIFSELMEDHS